MVIQTKTKIREWGNSFGVVIPRELVIREGFKVNDRVTISIDKRQNLEEFFGKGKGKIKDAQKEKNEARKLWKMN
ncbi:MAG: AbrB/MazE/SpoVT family DNA-binding domain-containing protein [Nanoarchaeota archaeon]|nr:AbrB/MazE/SpoVT family DNA-binding domain-containing protein [Nanoarchaeota archaeon]